MKQIVSGIAVLIAFVFCLAAMSGGVLAQQNAYQKAFMLHRRAGGMPNLSVVGPLDVLRRKMMLDMMERRMKSKINANNEFLSRLGKRAQVAPVFNELLQQEWLDNLDSSEA